MTAEKDVQVARKKTFTWGVPLSSSSYYLLITVVPIVVCCFIILSSLWQSHDVLIIVVTRVTCCPPVPVRVHLKTQVSTISADDDNNNNNNDDDNDNNNDEDGKDGDDDVCQTNSPDFRSDCWGQFIENNRNGYDHISESPQQ